ncbi:MAG: CocE/NonD family hydrolase [Microthrixaceae bacterium]|nr:CocE/NonD family hydrolase [Microthrixaceae bacterium]
MGASTMAAVLSRSVVSRGGVSRGGVSRGRAGRRAVGGLVALVMVATAVACSPPAPLDLTGTDGPYGVTVTRNLTIPLDDGRVLRADLYEPTDPDTGTVAAGPFPVIVGMTPYGKSGAAGASIPGGNGVNLQLVRHGYLALAVDVPGTGISDGSFDLFDPAEATAGAQIVRWAAALPRSTGRVGMLGLSYMAIVQLFTAAAVGPDSPLKAIFPMAATVDPYRDLFTSGGALNVLSPLGLLFGYGITRSVTPFAEAWDDPALAMQHAAANLEQMGRFEGVIAQDMFDNGPRRYDGDWWQLRRPERVLQRIADNGVAVHLVGGLYDVFQRGEPLLYSGLQNAAAGRPVEAPMLAGQPVSDRFRLLTGPWTHGTIGEGIDLSAVQLAWFDRWLKDVPHDERQTEGEQSADGDPAAPLRVIEPGGTTYDAATYPLVDAPLERLYLRADGRLDPEPPGTDEPSDGVDYFPLGDPCTASTVQFAAGLGAKDCLVPRPTVPEAPNEVTFSTDPLAEPLTLAGPVLASLAATSNSPDVLFSVTVEDVAPDGTSMGLTGGAILGSMRALDDSRSWTDAQGRLVRPHQLLTAAARQSVPVGEAVRYPVEVRPAFVTVPAGHRLRLRVSTADFPHFLPLADMAGLAGGHQDLHHSVAQPSYLDLSVRRP